METATKINSAGGTQTLWRTDPALLFTEERPPKADGWRDMPDLGAMLAKKNLVV